jgi:uncharacterized protein YjlB
MNKDRAKAPREPEVAVHYYDADGSIPNNPALPLLIYQGVLHLASSDVRETCDVSEACIERFADHGWHGAWRNGIYPFPHYHSTATARRTRHSASARARPKVRLGGKRGLVISVKAGDALVLPAGTGHQNLGSSANLLVVGAYPHGMDWDLCRGMRGQRKNEFRNIQAVPLPDSDPLFGRGGPLTRLWRYST